MSSNPEKSIEALLEGIRNRPVMYLGSKSVRNLKLYLDGYYHALYTHEVECKEEDDFWGQFQLWIESIHHIKTSHGWAGIIDFYSFGNAEASLDRFFQLYDEFRNLKATGELPTLSRN